MRSFVPPPADEEDGPFGAADYVQLACMSGRSARVIVRQHGRTLGEILVWEGDLWSARDRAGRGDAALERLAFAEHVVAHAHTLSAEELGEREFSQAWQHALIEAARRHDEAGRISEDDDGASGVHPRLDPAPRASEPARVIVPPPARIPPPRQREAVEVRVVVEPARDAAAPERVEADGTACFETCFDDAIEALLGKRFEEAHQAFAAAERCSPGDARVRANLARLEEMGFGGVKR